MGCMGFDRQAEQFLEQRLLGKCAVLRQAFGVPLAPLQAGTGSMIGGPTMALLTLKPPTRFPTPTPCRYVP